MSGKIYEFTIIANAVDGSQLVSHGYKGMVDMIRCVKERELYHFRGTSKLLNIVIVRADGQSVIEWPSIRPNDKDFTLENPADRRVFQQWYRDEDGRQASEVF